MKSLRMVNAKRFNQELLKALIQTSVHQQGQHLSPEHKSHNRYNPYHHLAEQQITAGKLKRSELPRKLETSGKNFNQGHPV